MIKGIIALFSSGLILAPQVLFGIVLGIFFSSRLEIEQIKEIYKAPVFYVAVIFLVSVYVYLFKLTYKDSRGDIDWVDNFLRIVGYSVMFFVANLSTLCFIYSFIL